MLADPSDLGRSALRHPDAASLIALWDELRGDRPAPFRAEFDAGKIGAKAPFLAILEHVGPSNLRIRIAGDRLNKWFGLELRGMSALSLVVPEARNHFQAALNRVIDDPAAAALHGPALSAGGAAARFEMALAPMRSDFGRIDRVLVGLWLLDHTGPFGPMRLTIDEVSIAPVPVEGRPRLVASAAETDAPPPAEEPQRRGHLRVVK